MLKNVELDINKLKIRLLPKELYDFVCIALNKDQNLRWYPIHMLFEHPWLSDYDCGSHHSMKHAEIFTLLKHYYADKKDENT